MKATDLRKGMTVQTVRGPKVVQSSTAVTGGRLQRVAFADGDICLCPPDSEFRTMTRNRNPRR